MRTAGVDWQLVAYGGALHAFTNPKAGNDPSKGAAYNQAADKRSWQAMKIFLEEIFAPREEVLQKVFDFSAESVNDIPP